MRPTTSPRACGKRRTHAATGARTSAARDMRRTPEAPRINLYDEVTARIVGEPEAGRVPWVHPWGRPAGPAPASHAMRSPRGIIPASMR